MAWLRLAGAELRPAHLSTVSNCRYAQTVFVADPWPEVYVRTEDRHASFERAARSFGPTVQAYVDAGYSTSVLPKASVEERVDFIVRELKLTSPCR